MKRLIVTDTHLGLYQDADKWLDIVLQFFKDIVVYCHKNEIKEIIHLGDFFDNRRSLNTKTQNTAHRIAKILGVKDIYTRIIVGNHDCYYKNRLHPTSLELFTEYKHIDIVDKPMLDDGILLLPWGIIPEKDDGHNAPYCFGHFAFNGFHMNDSYVCKTGVDPLTVKDFDLVLSGHFHTPSQEGNIAYLGAPYGQTFHDNEGARGFYIFEEGNLEFVEYVNAPVFRKIKSAYLELDNSEEFLEEKIKGNVIRLVFTKDHGTIKNQELQDKVLKYEPFAYSIDFTKIETEEGEISEEEAAVIENREQLITEYIASKKDIYPDNIQLPLLTGMFKKIMGEADENNL